MSIPDVPLGVQGKATLGPRWQRFRELNNFAAGLLGQGRYVEALEPLEAAYRETLVDDVDIAGIDARARVLSNLSSTSENLGRIDESLRQAAEALEACDVVLAAAGDHYGTRAAKSAILINRAQTYHQIGRLAESLADIDDALELAAGNTAANDRLLTVNLYNTKTVTLTAMGRWEEAETQARLALDLALNDFPELVGYPYGNLASIKQATGDLSGSKEFLLLAAEAHQATGNHPSHAMATANLGRLAVRNGDFKEAATLFAQAEEAFTQIQQPIRVAEIRYSQGLLALQSGDFDTARRLLTDAVRRLEAAGISESLAECHGYLADMLAAAGDFPAADISYDRARNVYAAMGNPTQQARIDGLRAVSRFIRAATVPPDQREPLLLEALNLGLPAALATDAVRHRFSPGPARERWVTTVAAPIMSFSFALAVHLDDTALLWELIENTTATVNLTPQAAANPIEADLGRALTTLSSEEPQAAFAHLDLAAGRLPFAASAFLTESANNDMFPTPRFDLPPRLRIDPDRSSILSDWIDLAEQRYGIAIRSREEIDSWLTSNFHRSTSTICFAASMGPFSPPSRSRSSIQETCSSHGGGSMSWRRCVASSSHKHSWPMPSTNCHGHCPLHCRASRCLKRWSDR